MGISHPDCDKLVIDKQTSCSSSTVMPPFTKMTEMTPENTRDYIARFAAETTAEKQLERLLWLLEGTRGVDACNLVCLYEHSLQTASRAFRNGEDAETVVCALFHDVGEVLNHVNHGEIAASLLRPYISEKNYWVLQHHEIFQTYYYGAACGVDPNLREKFRTSPYFDACEKFCPEYDMTSFDPNYISMDIEEFKPLILSVLTRVPYSLPGLLEDSMNQSKAQIVAVSESRYQGPSLDIK